ncbi:MAG: GNAT family N-acetyltransferase [Hyphomonadaceae bacterium]|nr:GNAT family N-acetyltransferase [Hyphomonadaceae bacterium]
MAHPAIGRMALRQPARHQNRADITVRVVRTLDDLQRVSVLRGLTYMAEQDCPYDEEFDGNDLCGLHLLAFVGKEPAGTLRLRFFNGFVKLERLCVDRRQRGGAVASFLLSHAFEITARKGFPRVIAHIQERLEGWWTHIVKCQVVGRQTFDFSGYSYLVLEIPLPKHPQAIQFESNPYVMIRPEGEWDHEGILDPKSSKPQTSKPLRAAPTLQPASPSPINARASRSGARVQRPTRITAA